MGWMENSAVPALWLVRPDHDVTLSGISRWKLTRSENKPMSSHPWMTLVQADVCTDTQAPTCKLTHKHTRCTSFSSSLPLFVSLSLFCLLVLAGVPVCLLGCFCSPCWHPLYHVLAHLCQPSNVFIALHHSVYLRLFPLSTCLCAGPVCDLRGRATPQSPPPTSKKREGVVALVEEGWRMPLGEVWERYSWCIR